jgi:hypothetical protein
VALTAGVLYARDLRVTRTMVTIGDAHYPVAGISGVRITSAPRALSWAWACGVLFALLAVVEVAAMTSHDVRVVGDVADAISRAAHARG